MPDRHGPHGLKEDDPRLDDAWAFVIEHQGEQVRKGTQIPYTTHLQRAAHRVLDDGGTVEEAAAALLHDVVEDTPVTQGGHSVDLEEVRERFGERVAEVVGYCTDAAPPPGMPKAPWRGRKETHFAHLRGADPGTLRVVAADKTDNLTHQLADLDACADDPAAFAESLARFKGGFAGTLWYYRNMHAAMGDELADSALYREFTELIAEFASRWSPEGEVLARRARVRAVLDDLDPSGVGPGRVAADYYAIDADELARRISIPGAPPAEDVVATLVTQWYGRRPGSDEPVWSLADRQPVAEALR